MVADEVYGGSFIIGSIIESVSVKKKPVSIEIGSGADFIQQIELEPVVQPLLEIESRLQNTIIPNIVLKE